jgi:hypothetical protein
VAPRRSFGIAAQLFNKVRTLIRHTYGADLEKAERGTPAKRATPNETRVMVGERWRIRFFKHPAPVLKAAGGFTRRPDAEARPYVVGELQFRGAPGAGGDLSDTDGEVSDTDGDVSDAEQAPSS